MRGKREEMRGKVGMSAKRVVTRWGMAAVAALMVATAALAVSLSPAPQVGTAASHREEFATLSVAIGTRSGRGGVEGASQRMQAGGSGRGQSSGRPA